MCAALSASLAVLTQSQYDEYLALPAVKSLEKDKTHAVLFQLLQDLSFGSLANTLKSIAQHEAYWVKIGACVEVRLVAGHDEGSCWHCCVIVFDGLARVHHFEARFDAAGLTCGTSCIGHVRGRINQGAP